MLALAGEACLAMIVDLPYSLTSKANRMRCRFLSDILDLVAASVAMTTLTLLGRAAG
jgi:hypothetical protein